MNNYHSALVEALERVLPTYYELILNSSIKTPCISYMGLNNAFQTQATGNTLGYARVSYRVKVWGEDLEQLLAYVSEIDKELRPLGYTRVSCGELYDKESAMIQVVMTYEGLALEKFN